MLAYNIPHLDIAALILLQLATWLPSLKGFWLIDDQDGIARFSDRIKDGEKIDWYEHEVNKEKKKFKHLAFNKHISFPGSVIRWFRLNWGASFKVLGKDKKGHEIYGNVQSPVKHHALSIILNLANSILCYFFLLNLFGNPIAFMGTALFIVHPLGCQTTAWISGIGYLICLFGALCSFNVAFYVDNDIISSILVLFFTFLSAYGLFSGALNFIILLALGYPILAGVAFIVFIANAYKQGRQIVGKRSDEFKKQNMGHSTFLNWKKPIVMLKTFAYYLYLIPFPKRLGLFHAWGYHYDQKTERIDWRVWCGLLGVSAFVYAAITFEGPVRFAIIWWVVYLAIFTNFITAMQFVADRYAYISALGWCIFLATIFRDYPIVIGIIGGLYLMRTWVHIPSFRDEETFYRSNTQNFPTSEVALGNLGVTLMNQGTPGSAVDTWNKAIKLNPHYDVPHYNMYSIMRNNGQLKIAYDHLTKCLNAKTVHFPDIWNKEKVRLDQEMFLNQPLRQHLEVINRRYRECN